MQHLFSFHRLGTTIWLNFLAENPIKSFLCGVSHTRRRKNPQHIPNQWLVNIAMILRIILFTVLLYVVYPVSTYIYEVK